MKNLFFLLCLIPFASFAQNDDDRLLKFTGDSSFGRLIKMPELKRGELYGFFEIGGRSKYGYTVDADTLYRKIFAAYPKDSLPAVDFSKEELLLSVYCPQCMVLCLKVELLSINWAFVMPAQQNKNKVKAVFTNNFITIEFTDKMGGELR